MSNVPHHTTAVSVNQNQGGSIYPFMEPCKLAGIVSDIRVTFFYDEDIPPGSVHDLYVVISRAGRTVPRLLFFSSKTAERPLFDTEDMALKYAQDNLWFFLSPDGRQTVYYSEYDGSDKTIESAECIQLISRCWAPCVSTVGHFGNVGAGLEIVAEYPVVCEVSAKDDLTEVVIRDDEHRPPANESLKTINRAAGNTEGNFSIHGDNQSIVVTALLTLPAQVPDVHDRVTGKPVGVAIRHDGSACCTCEDYAKKFEELKALVKEHNYEISFLDYLKEYYNVLLARYYEVTEERLGDTVQLRATPGRKQSMFTFSVSNPLGQRIFNVRIKLDITCEKSGRTRAVYIDGAYSSGDYPEYEFIVPELKAHSQWTGSVVIAYFECGLTAIGKLSVSLPWLRDEETVRESFMSCEYDGRYPVRVPAVRSESVEIPLPKPPDKAAFFAD